MLKVVGSLFAVIAWFAFVGLQRVWHATFGWLFNTLANLLDKAKVPIPHFHDIHPFGSVSAWLRSLDRNVSSQLAHLANDSEHLAVWLFSRLHLGFAWLGREVEGLAADTLGFGLKLFKSYLPRFFRWQVRLYLKPIHAALNAVRKLIPQLTKRILRLGRWAVHAVASNYKRLGFLWSWAKAVIKAHLRFFRAIWKRLTRLEHWIVPKKFQGLVRNALRVLGLEWIFGTNVGTLAVWAVGFDIGSVREWVKDAVTIVATTDLCKLAAYQFDLAVYVFDPIMQAIIGLTEWFCFHSGDQLPSATKGTGGYTKAWAPSATPAIDGPYLPERLAPDIPLPRGVIQA